MMSFASFSPVSSVRFMVVISIVIHLCLGLETLANRRSYFPPACPKACYFTGAGIYFWWQAGCAKYMQEHCDMSKMPIIGASAGSISATLLLAEIDFDEAAAAALRIGSEAKVYERGGGLAGIWGSLLRQWLEEMIPDDVDENKFERLQVALTPTLKTPKLVSNFQNKDEVIEALLASCHVPVFLDGRPTTSFRGEQVLDGSFWYFVTKDRVSGLPLPRDIDPGDLFWVDYGDDDDFMQSISGNILELVTPQRVLEMVDEGYNFMKREHYYGRLPMARLKKPNFVYSSDPVSGVFELNQMAQKRVANFLSPIKSAVESFIPSQPLTIATNGTLPFQFRKGTASTGDSSWTAPLKKGEEGVEVENSINGEAEDETAPPMPDTPTTASPPDGYGPMGALWRPFAPLRRLSLTSMTNVNINITTPDWMTMDSYQRFFNLGEGSGRTATVAYPTNFFTQQMLQGSIFDEII